MASAESNWALDYYDSVLNFDLEWLKYIVDRHGVDLNANFTKVRQTNQYHLDQGPVHLAVQTEGNHFEEMVQYLQEMKCDFDRRTATLRRTPLHLAVLWCNAPCVERLLDMGSKPDPRDSFNNSPCHYAAENGSCDILDILLRCCREEIDVDAQDIALKTALMKASRNKEVDAVGRLLNAGCCVNLTDANKDTALHFAVRTASSALHDILLISGSEINVQNQRGHTPLIESVCYNNKDSCSKLIRAGCLINTQESKGGNTALHFAVQKNYNSTVDELLSTHKVKQVYNNQGESPVFEAVRNQRLETIRIFLRHNYDLTTPVTVAIGNGLARSSNGDPSSTSTKTVVQVAIDRGNLKLLRLLANVGFLLSTNPQSHGTPIVIDPDQAAIFEKFFSEVCPVPSLKQMVRLLIRSLLGYGLYEKVMDLPLPQHLREYVMLCDLL